LSGRRPRRRRVIHDVEMDIRWTPERARPCSTLDTTSFARRARGILWISKLISFRRSAARSHSPPPKSPSRRRHGIAATRRSALNEALGGLRPPSPHCGLGRPRWSSQARAVGPRWARGDSAWRNKFAVGGEKAPAPRLRTRRLAYTLSLAFRQRVPRQTCQNAAEPPPRRIGPNSSPTPPRQADPEAHRAP